MQHLLEQIRLARFRFHLECVTPLDLPPYKGSTFRGAFGMMLKDVVCVQRQLDRCEPCLLRLTCVYPYLFETPNFKPEASLLPPDGQAPQPFVLEPPLEEKTRYAPGETLSFDVVLIGKALDYLPYVIFVFTEIGRKGIGKGRGKYRLAAVTVEIESGRGGEWVTGRMGEWENGGVGERETGGGGDTESRAVNHTAHSALCEVVIYDGATRMIHNPPVGYDRVHPDAGSVPGDQLTVRFLTPTRIKEQGRFISRPTFQQLIKHLLLRVSLLADYHCDLTLDLDFKSLIEQSQAVQTVQTHLHWHDWERYSNRQQTRMSLGGFVGDIVIAGDLQPWLPLLRLGEYVHVGKATSFGLGKYEIKQG